VDQIDPRIWYAVAAVVVVLLLAWLRHQEAAWRGTERDLFRTWAPGSGQTLDPPLAGSGAGRAPWNRSPNSVPAAQLVHGSPALADFEAVVCNIVVQQ
jgi:hypothetical protein